MNQEDQARKWQDIVAKAEKDDVFKKRLLALPTVVLKEGGVEIPPDVQVRMLQNTDKVWHFVLPPPLSEELPAEQLANVAGGAVTPGTSDVVKCESCSNRFR